MSRTPTHLGWLNFRAEDEGAANDIGGLVMEYVAGVELDFGEIVMVDSAGEVVLATAAGEVDVKGFVIGGSSIMPAGSMITLDEAQLIEAIEAGTVAAAINTSVLVCYAGVCYGKSGIAGVVAGDRMTVDNTVAGKIQDDAAATRAILVGHALSAGGIDAAIKVLVSPM